MLKFTSPFTIGETSFQAEITIILLIFIALVQVFYDIMSIDNSAHFFYFLLRCLQKKSRNQTVKIKLLKSKITFNKRSLYPTTKTKTKTYFLTKLPHPHQKFLVFFTVHIHPRAINYVLILHPLENKSHI